MSDQSSQSGVLITGTQAGVHFRSDGCHHFRHFLGTTDFENESARPPTTTTSTCDRQGNFIFLAIQS
eukprot:scaffold3254_cov72-Skeletonema_dohrnii-CCMP3373.AAC.2